MPMGKRRPATPLASTPRTLHGAFPVASLDLHGRTAREVRSAVFGFLQREAAVNAGDVVEIVTGRGTNSEGAPVLFGLVRALLEDDLAHLVDEMSLNRGAGGWLVRLRPRE